MTQDPGLTDIQLQRIRARERRHDAAGAGEYRADRELVLKALNEALATELICVLRYKRHYYAADGIHAESAKAQFLEHAVQESQHADLLAERIIQLGGRPNFSPVGIAGRAQAEQVEGTTLKDMLGEDLIAERIAIETYKELVRYVGERDPTTRRLLEQVLAVEEEHAQHISSLLSGLVS